MEKEKEPPPMRRIIKKRDSMNRNSRSEILEEYKKPYFWKNKKTASEVNDQSREKSDLKEKKDMGFSIHKKRITITAHETNRHG